MPSPVSTLPSQSPGRAPNTFKFPNQPALGSVELLEEDEQSHTQIAGNSSREGDTTHRDDDRDSDRNYGNSTMSIITPMSRNHVGPGKKKSTNPSVDFHKSTKS